MMNIRTVVSFSALVAVFAGMNVANAQTPKAHLASATPQAASSWACQTKIVEIAPVSQDTSGRAMSWVMVHRVNGEIIAAERLSNREVEQIRRLPCQGDRLEAPPPLVG